MLSEKLTRLPRRSKEADYFQVVTVDNRETGGTGASAAPFTLADCATDVLDTLTALGHECFGVVGTSMGGMIAQEVVRLAPERARAAVFDAVLGRGCRTVEPTAVAEQAWLARLHADSRSRPFGGGDEGEGDRSLYVPGSAECTPGYYNNEGQPTTPAHRASLLGFPGGPLAFFSYIEEWRSSGEFEGLELV